MERILEPEVMDTEAEAMEYDSMDFTVVNAAFAQRVMELGPANGRVRVLDAGTGTARIPILIAQARPSWQIFAIDLAQSMLAIAEKNVMNAHLEQQIRLEFIDVKQLPYADCSFDGVISNSLVHHLPDPLPFFQELKRVLKPNGFLVLRDLLRPATPAIADALVATIGPEYSSHQTQLFRDSLYAAFTIEELQQLVQKAGLSNVRIYPSSERHWTIERAYSAGKSII
ncbi:MAG: class I SAM-dependent methyltransferase [Snowella sp.]|nr:class I SAM-dependent methyltransferase [Snowella sp.]